MVAVPESVSVTVTLSAISAPITPDGGLGVIVALVILVPGVNADEVLLLVL